MPALDVAARLHGAPARMWDQRKPACGGTCMPAFSILRRGALRFQASQRPSSVLCSYLRMPRHVRVWWAPSSKIGQG